MTAGAPIAALRPATPDDEAFLRALHASTREDLAAVGWDAATRNAVLRLQFDAQDRSWRAVHPSADVDVVLVDDAPVGRLVADRSGAEVHVVDVALSPDHRGRGIGTALLTGLLADADAQGRAVVLAVDRGSPARRLYERLGFRVVGEDDVRLALRREPVGR